MQSEFGMVAVAHIALQLIALLATVLAFRAAAAVPGLAGWQAAATGATWLLLGGHGSSLAGLVLLALVLVWAVRARVGSDEAHLATLLGIVVVAGVLWNGRGEGFRWVPWLLPVAPLLLPAA